MAFQKKVAYNIRDEDLAFVIRVYAVSIVPVMLINVGLESAFCFVDLENPKEKA